MHRDCSSDTVLRFQIQVPRAEYRSLVSRLRGESASSLGVSSDQAQVTALIDLLPDASTFSVTRLGCHRLPRAVSIRAGSPTHHLLSHTISKEIQRIDDPAVTARLREIIDACPKSLPSSLRINPADFVISPPSSIQTPTQSSSSLSNSNIRILATLSPTILLDLDDQPTLVITDSDLSTDEASHALVQATIADTLKVHTHVTGNTVTLTGSAAIPKLPNHPRVTLVAHWGCYDELAKSWQDEQMVLATNTHSTYSENLCNVTFATTLHVPIHGRYGVTFFALLNDSRERIWIGRPWLDDHKFNILNDDPDAIKTHYESRRELFEKATTQARAVLSDPSNAQRVTTWFHELAPHLSLGAILASETSHSQATCDVLENCIATLRRRGAVSLADNLSRTYGVGEIVFVTPEGPHAAAGGLAHVITGLPIELTKCGVPVTIIAPLYRYANGNKHRSAEEILKDGVILGTERIIPRYATTVIAGLGPTHYVGTGYHKRPATGVPFKVYVAECGKLRLILLANSSVFDRLYQPVYADEQLRRAILFSRGALETITIEALDIRPSALISNDWMTACVPGLLALDQRYQGVPWLRRAKALHMIHNGGADYHGRLPLHFGNEDLWPLFGLPPEHYFGFRDPHRDDLINLTMGAVQHANGGVLTVSKPYAQTLVSTTGGDGLGQILQHRSDSVFGMSNGINRDDIDGYLAARVGRSEDDLRSAPGILDAKTSIRVEVQRKLGLSINHTAPIVSFVGRLAEQKGLDLLSGIVAHAPHSALEDLLVRHPGLQIIIAGPLTAGDCSATALHDAARYLQHHYPGRVAAVFDYISHSHALEIMAASTLFLMPSRFEPGGITQLEALAVGTPVVGRCVGGIGATIDNYDPVTGRGTGFLCYEHSSTAFANTIHWALATCADARLYRSLVEQTISARHSWNDRAPTFLAVLQRVILGISRAERLEVLETSSHLVTDAQVSP
jgi:starch synthase